MMDRAEHLPVVRPAHKVGRPPIPHEHGAWIMLYVPLIVGFQAAGGASGWQWAALIAAVTGLFLAREAAGLLIRKRGKPGTALWLYVYLLLSAAGAAPLLLGPAAPSLLLIGVFAAALFGVHSLLLVLPARKRLDRSAWGEILGAGGLTLTAPSAFAIARGSLEPGAWAIWAFCLLYFAGAIFYVKMWLEAVKYKKVWSQVLRKEIGRGALLYHIGLAAMLVGLAWFANRGGGVLLLAAFTPALLRAFHGYLKLSPVLPNLKRVGFSESGIALWFGCFLILAAAAGL